MAKVTQRPHTGIVMVNAGKSRHSCAMKIAETKAFKKDREANLKTFVKQDSKVHART